MVPICQHPASDYAHYQNNLVSPFMPDQWGTLLYLTYRVGDCSRHIPLAWLGICALLAWPRGGSHSIPLLLSLSWTAAQCLTPPPPARP